MFYRMTLARRRARVLATAIVVAVGGCAMHSWDSVPLPPTSLEQPGFGLIELRIWRRDSALYVYWPLITHDSVIGVAGTPGGFPADKNCQPITDKAINTPLDKCHFAVPLAGIDSMQRRSVNAAPLAGMTAAMIVLVPAALMGLMAAVHMQ